MSSHNQILHPSADAHLQQPCCVFFIVQIFVPSKAICSQIEFGVTHSFGSKIYFEYPKKNWQKTN